MPRGNNFRVTAGRQPAASAGNITTLRNGPALLRGQKLLRSVERREIVRPIVTQGTQRVRPLY